MNHFNKTNSCLLILLLFLSANLYSQIQLPAIFTDNMVLQQQSNTPFWGKAAPGEEIKIIPSWNKKEYKSVSDAVGNWKIQLETPVAGGPYEILISGKKTIRIKNVLIGEVWLCSGQSNMEMPLAGWGKVANYEKEISTADYPNIRLLQVEKATSLTPVSDVKVSGDSWQVCSPATIPEFSATAYFFGRSLYQKLGVPIGLIHSSWGGTPAEAWTSAGSLQLMPDFKSTIDEINTIPQDAEIRNALCKKKQMKYDQELMAKDFGYKDNSAIASTLAYDDTDWKNMNLPGLWENSGLPDFDGLVWFRRTIDIPAEWANKKLHLSLGTVDDNEITYFNGVEIGRTNGYSTDRNYLVPANLVKKGKAVITVRVMDTGGEGGFYGEKEKLYLKPAKPVGKLAKLDLSGNWKYKVALNMKEIPPLPWLYTDNSSNPTSLYNAMIHPLIPYTIKGAIWYQGEANEARGYQYRTLFPLLINDWRTQWGINFPFYFVQLANFRQAKEQPSESDWAEVREAQLGALRLENTGMVVTIDIGDANDVHPKNKQEVGSRLALIAATKTYNGNNAYSGPIYESYRVEGNKVRVNFAYTDTGLKIKDGTVLKGFSIAGPDRKFYWANAVIDGNTVVVNSPEVPFPLAVRYAWANNPDCNLYNGAGLPASPFRTDDWPGITFDNAIFK